MYFIQDRRPPDLRLHRSAAVPGVGFEPTRPLVGQRGLSPPRLTCSATRAAKPRYPRLLLQLP